MSLFDLACSQAWAMRETELRNLLAIVQRESLDPDLARQIREDRAERLSLSARPAIRLDGARNAQLRDGIALIEIVGPIVRRADMFSDISGATSTQSIMHDLTVALNAPNVEAVLFVIDSPGGEVTGLTEAAQQILTARAQKPIWAYIEGNGASAAYWLGSSSERVVVSETADVGWIGVVWAMRDPAKAKSDKIEFVSSQTPKKRPDVTTEAGKAQIQEAVDATADVFFADVARGRGVSVETVLSDFGQGGGLIGKAAVAADMADATGTFESTLTELRKEVAKRRQRPRMAARQEDSMKFSEMVTSIFRGAKDAGIEIEPDAPAVAEPTQAAAPVVAPVVSDPVITAELEALRAKLAKQEQAALDAKAEQFADGAIRASQALPAERAQLIALYKQSAATAEGTATLEALIAARPPHTLASEQVSVGAGGVLETGAQAAGMSEERRQKLLSMTPLGQAVRRTTSA